MALSCCTRHVGCYFEDAGYSHVPYLFRPQSLLLVAVRLVMISEEVYRTLSKQLDGFQGCAMPVRPLSSQRWMPSCWNCLRVRLAPGRRTPWTRYHGLDINMANMHVAMAPCFHIFQMLFLRRNAVCGSSGLWYTRSRQVYWPSLPYLLPGVSALVSWR